MRGRGPPRAIAAVIVVFAMRSPNSVLMLGKMGTELRTRRVSAGTAAAGAERVVAAGAVVGCRLVGVATGARSGVLM
jgi:hypothetical protein